MAEKNKKNKILRAVLVSICSVCIAALSFMGYMDKPLDYANIAKHSNDAYLEIAQERAVGGFLTLSAAKSGLAILEGSTVNISIFGNGTSVQAGDSIQAVYDLTDWLWKTTFYGGVILTALRTLLSMASLLSPYALGICALLLAFVAPAQLYWRHKSFYRSVYNTLVLIASVFLICQFAIPLSIWTASKLSIHLTRQVAEESEKNFKDFGAIFDRNDTESAFDFGKRIVSNMPSVLARTKASMKGLVVSGMKYMTAYLFDCLLFPLAMFEILKRIMLVLLKYIFEPDGRKTPRPWLDWLLPPPLPIPMPAGAVIPQQIPMSVNAAQNVPPSFAAEKPAAQPPFARENPFSGMTAKEDNADSAEDDDDSSAVFSMPSSDIPEQQGSANSKPAKAEGEDNNPFA